MIPGEVERDGVKIFAPKLESKYDYNIGFKSMCRTLVKRTRNDYDAVLAITGDEGVSKSTCAHQVGFATDPHYSFGRNVLYSPTVEDLVKAVRQLPRFSTINADEAMKILYKQEWWLQTFLNKFYALCRQDNKISILCIPRFTDLNINFREHRVLFWVHLLDRGIGVVMQKDWSPYTKDPWWFDKNQKRIEKMSKFRKFHQFSLDQKISILMKSQNFMDVVTFPDLPEAQRIEYKLQAATHKYEGMDAEYKKTVLGAKMKARYNERFIKLNEFMKKQLGMTQDDVGKILGVPGSTVSHWLKEGITEE